MTVYLSSMISMRGHPFGKAENGRKICIVDDDEAVRDSLKVLLESHGHEVSDFASPLDLLATDTLSHCDCLIIDQHMPAMSGVELVEVLRAKDVAVPTLMVTGRPDCALIERLGQAGRCSLYAKPVSDEVLLDGIARALAAPIH